MSTERERQPYVQIDTDLWAVMRESKEQPRAMILRIADRQQIEKYLLLTWHPEPHRRRLIAIYDTLQEANHAVRWDISKHRTGRENHKWGGDHGLKRRS